MSYQTTTRVSIVNQWTNYFANRNHVARAVLERHSLESGSPETPTMTCNHQPQSRKGAAVNGAQECTFRRQTRTSVLAAMLLTLWSVVHILAAAPLLHHELHPEASSPHHRCLITEFSGGSFESAPDQPDLAIHSTPVMAQAQIVSEAPRSSFFFQPHAARPPPAVLQSFSQAGS